MTQEELNTKICAITQEVLNKLDIEEIIRETMIDYDIHPFSDDVTDTQVHIAFNEIYEEIIGKFQHDRGLF